MTYSTRTISDLIYGDIDNMPDNELDRDIKRFAKINYVLNGIRAPALENTIFFIVT